MTIRTRTLAFALALPLGALLTACGPQEPAPATTIEVATQADSGSRVVEADEPPLVRVAAFGEDVELVDGVVVRVSPSSWAANAYSAQFTSSGPEWAGLLADFSGLDAAGDVVAQTDGTLWPENPRVDGRASIMGGTLVFAGPVDRIVYSPSDAASVVWS